MRRSFKRFYKQVSLAEEPGEGWRLLLDGKPVRTSAGRVVVIAHPALAEALAEEWRVQGERAELASMPLTRLAMSVLDHVVPRVHEVRQEALAYGKTDLLCYRASEPERLAERQAASWQPYLDWAAETLGARLKLASGLTAISQHTTAIAALERATEALDPYRLLVLHGLTTRLGSLVLALAVVYGRIGAAEAVAASRLDEAFQAETWGRDEAAEERAEQIGREARDLERLLSLLA